MPRPTPGSASPPALPCSRSRSGRPTAARSRRCPAPSALARSGAMAAVASGKAGRRVADRPELAHEAVDDAARRPAGEDVGERGVPAASLFSAARCTRAGRGLGAEQVGGADLDAGGAERHRGRHARGIRDAAGRDHRHRTARDDLRHAARTCRSASSDRRTGTVPRWPPASSPCAMIASTPRASSQRASSTVVADERIFAPQPRTRAQQLGRRQAEVEAHDLGGLTSSSTSAASALNGSRPAPAGSRLESIPSSS